MSMAPTSRGPRVRAGQRESIVSFAWAAVAACVVAVGCLLTLLAARDAAQDEETADRRAFERSATEISSALQAALQRGQDLNLSTGAMFAANLELTNGGLDDWLSSVRAETRQPELLAMAVMRIVADDDLEQFETQLRADPDSGVTGAGGLEVVPPGPRPFYCLVQATVMFGPSPTTLPAGVDYCASEVGPAILEARDSGEASYVALPSDGGTQLVVQTPLYGGHSVPPTIDERRARYVGSIGTAILPDVLFAQVLGNDPDAGITLSYDAPGSAASFTTGAVGPQAISTTDDFGNGWTATISRPAPSTGLVESMSALRILAAGFLASGLVGALILVLGTSRKRALRLVGRRTDELHYQALHDGLTGLPNRTLILDRADQMLARGRRNGTDGAALFVDLDGFKAINDSLGHDAGDQLLQAVAARLTTSLRGVDTVGRMGGDEFVVLLDGGSLGISPELVAARIIDVVRQPFDLDRAGRPVTISASVGIATGDRDQPADLLRDADIALYQAKQGGRNRYTSFRPDMEQDLQAEFELDLDLRSALAEGQLELFYQPIYDLSNFTIIGAEALIRWRHPVRGTLQPDEFIHKLERSGQIIDVGRWVLLEACQQAAQWHAQGSDLTISVNVSAKQLDDDTIIDHVADALAASGIEPARLTIEITESVLMKDTNLTALRLHDLKRLGVKLAIDDFGTGYSSLAYLQRFPVDCIKIDRSFTDAINRGPESDALVHTLVQLGKDLGLSTLAEGVETVGQLDFLRGVDVDEAQGFLLAHPLTAQDFSEQVLLPAPVVKHNN